MPASRIAMVAHRLDEGQRTGIERYTYELFDALRQQADPSEFQFELHSFQQLAKGRLFDVASLQQIVGCDVGAQLDADLVHCTTPINLRCKVPLVVSVCDLIPFVMPRAFAAHVAPVYAALMFQLRRRAAAFIAISGQTRDDVVRFARVGRDDITVTHLGIGPEFRTHSPEELAPVLARHGLSAAPYVLYVGGMHRRKNVTRLLQAYVSLRRRVPDAPPLALAGRENWGGDEVRAEIERAGLLGDVRFLGYVAQEDLPPLIAGAALFVFPSLYEGFGFPPLEAMASGTPTATSEAGSLVEVAGPALTFDPYDVQDIARVMAEGLQLSGSALQHVREESIAWARGFDWERTANETLAVYRRVLGRR